VIGEEDFAADVGYQVELIFADDTLHAGNLAIFGH